MQEWAALVGEMESLGVAPVRGRRVWAPCAAGRGQSTLDGLDDGASDQRALRAMHSSNY